MIFKVYYQEDPTINPLRESTQSLYLEADSEAQARAIVANNVDYNVEFIEALSEAALEYEKNSKPDFAIVEFDK
ncbi:DNA-directed RNA polymerase subunit epsilon [Ligilactobacillus ceti]|uniref:DNA-directed RNA polymerase subunit epsilon n=1 Tax=Ligilactobacillus ceti DSM 22408 TaxID=1122146 RepID=A0A0R2KMT0_9LACO|nr:DNA-directed RNA polymerase subunit epsilon [Ligilactobacillus ceti]KRN88934.1 hypothetical protein IV53_GL000904 [Ligilactobacillus ceti DSM 22408]